jgi:hypothetical protein
MFILLFQKGPVLTSHRDLSDLAGLNNEIETPLSSWLTHFGELRQLREIARLLKTGETTQSHESLHAPCPC